MKAIATLLFLLTVAAAEDEAPRASNAELGYSFPVAGLRRVNLNPVDQTVLTAFLTDDDDGSALFLERSAPRRRNAPAPEWPPREGAKDAARIGDRPAEYRAVRAGDRTLVTVTERVEPGEPYWSATLRIVGDSDQRAAHEKRLWAALATFTTDLSTEKREDDYEDRIFGFRIRLTGFEGRIQHFGFVVKEVYSIRIGDRHVGTLALIMSPAEKDREASIPEIRQRLAKEGLTVESVAETERSGRPAALFVSGSEDGKDHRLVVWDGPRLFTLVVTLHPGAIEAETEAAPLLAALAGFALD